MARLLLDNDVVVKLAQYDLLDEFLALLGHQDCAEVLPTLRYRLRLSDPQRAARILKDDAAVARIMGFLPKVTEIRDVPSADLVRRLEQRPELDPGEVVLFSIAESDAACFVCTGDKRAVTAIAHMTQKHEVLTSLRGRVKCLEQLVAEMMCGPNAGAVIHKIRSGTWDTALRLCFASGELRDVLAALNSYYRHLDGESAGLLAPFPALA